MISKDEDALICDFAETYHITDYKSLPLRTAATLAVGLGEDSRIKRKYSDANTSQGILLLSGINDRLTKIICLLTGSEMPKTITEVLIGKEKEEENEAIAFDSPEAFMRAREEILRKGGE